MNHSPILMPGKRLALATLQPCTMPVVDGNDRTPIDLGGPKVTKVCGTQSEELFCPTCWKRIPTDVRRAFNAERERMRKLGIRKTTELMKRIIAQCIIQGAGRK